jgi:pimeloyl-ACP methyl ester carboxylesterase
VQYGAVLVHGLWHGGWVWDEVRQRLDDAGIESVAVDLPLTSLADDVAVTRAALATFDRPAVLVGHSYGGAVITGAGTAPSVRHLIYLAAFQLDTGESVSRTLPDREIPGTRVGEAFRMDGELVWLEPELSAELMYHDADPQVAAAAMARLRPVQRAVFSGVPDEIAWHTVPSTYAVSARDEVVNPQLQRAMAERATASLEWACGHSAPVVRPDEVASLIAESIRLSTEQSG